MLNPKRLALLIRKQAVENYRFYLMTMALFAGLLICLYALTYPALQRPKEFQKALFIASLYLGGCVFSNLIVRDLHENTKAIWFLMLPASTLEKLLNIAFYGLVLFIPVHLLLFYAVDVTAVAVYNAKHPENPAARILDLFNEDMGTATTYFFFLVAQAVVLVGSVYFERYSLVKSLLGVFAFFFILFYLNQVIANSLIRQPVSNAFPFSGFTVDISGANAERIDVKLPESLTNPLRLAGRVLLIPFLWLVAYFKLKEREV